MPTWMRIATSRVRALFSRRRLDEDFRAELRSHVDLLTADHIRSGHAPAEARRLALLALGNPTTIAQEHRERRGLSGLENLAQDVRYAARLLRRRPGFTLVAAFTMALGIGVNTTVFTAFNAVALRPLPIKDGDRAVRLERWFQSRQRGSSQFLFSYAEYVHLRDHLDSVSHLVAVSVPIRVSASSHADSEAAESAPFMTEFVSDNFFSDLGVAAQVGRGMSADEIRVPGSEPVVFLSDACWRSRFNADPAVSGRTITLNGHALTIVGVAMPAFVGIGNPPYVPDVWVPLGLKTDLAPGIDWVHEPRAAALQLVGGLRPGTGLDAANARTQAIVPSLGRIAPVGSADDATIQLTLEPATFFAETNDPRFHVLVGLIMAVVGLILLAACANLANLLLARAAARHKEIGMRIALGASRWRIVRQLLVESVMLSVLGGACALAGSLWASRALWVRIAETVQIFAGGRGAFVVDLTPDARVFVYTLAVAVIAGAIFGLSPALQLARAAVSTAVKDENASAVPGLKRSRLRAVLVGGQVAVSMTLAISAGLLTRGLMRAETASVGFDTAPIYYVGYAGGLDAARAVERQRSLVTQLAAKPEVADVALADLVPFTGTRTRQVFATDPSGAQTSTVSLINHVSARFFSTVGIPLLRGRVFAETETATGVPIAVVSNNAARALWPGRDPVGQRLQVPSRGPREPLESFTVVGVVGDVRSANISRVDPAFVYLTTDANSEYHMLVRSTRALPALRDAVRASLAPIAPDAVRTLDVAPLDEFMRTQRVLPSTVATFALMLAVLAIALAASGIYGVVSFLASQREREIGIRMALGASAGAAVRLVLVQGLRPAAVGMLAGLGLAAGVSAILRAILAAPGTPDFLFGVAAFDPITFGALTLGVSVVALLAVAMPAWRTAHIDPLTALRRE